MGVAARRQGLGAWLQALRAYSFPASVVPVVVGAALALERGGAAWALFPVALVCSVLFQAGTNVTNDYFDFVRGVDRGGPNDGSSGVLTKGLLRPNQAFYYGVSLFAVGVLLGLVLVYYRGLPMLLLGLIGLLGGYLYTGGPKGYKYLALGDLLVFVLMGPLSVVGTYLALTGETSFGATLASVPVGLLVAEIMALNNHRDAATDQGAGIRTFSNVVGFRVSRVENVLLPVAAYAFVAAAVLGGFLSPWTLLVFLSAPLAWGILKVVWTSDEQGTAGLTYLVAWASQLHLAFGALLSVGIVLGALAS